MSDRREYLKKYREQHKQKIKELNNQKYKCDICDKDVTKYNKKKHEHSILHLQNKAHKVGLEQEEKDELVKLYNKVIGGLAKQMKQQKEHLKFTENL